MADVPFSVYIISNAVSFTAGALPVVVGWIRETGKDKRARAERLETERARLAQTKRGQCVRLIRLARNFRVLVEDAQDCREAKELAAYAKQIRQTIADVDGQADDVGFLVPAAEATASLLASTAARLAAAVTASDNREHGELLRKPEYEEFDQCLAEFKDAARAVLGDPAAITVNSGAEPDSGTPGIGPPGTGVGQP